MNRRKFPLVLAGLVTACLSGMPGLAFAQNYPQRDVTLVVPFNPGGVTDPIARSLAKQLEKELGVSVNVQNTPGGSGTIGANQVITAPADGYTIGIGTGNILAYQPLVNKSLPYKTTADFDLITKIVETPSLLVVKADAPWNNLQEFVAAAREKPGKIRAAVSGLRTAGDLSAQELNLAAGVKIATVPFTGGGGEALLSLLGGRVEALIGTTPSSKGQVDAGQVKVLAVFQKGKFDIFPKADSTVDVGFDAKTPQSFLLMAPKGLPADVRAKLVDASMKAINSADFTSFMQQNGYIVDAHGPEKAVEEIQRDGKAYQALIQYMDKQKAQ